MALLPFTQLKTSSAAGVLESCAAFALFLLLLITGSLLLQSAGHWLGINLVASALWIALIPSAVVSYGYFFPYNRTHSLIAVLFTAILLLLSLGAMHLWDFSSDGLGYQQAAAEDIFNGWNPFARDSISLWQNIYPSGVWAVEASIAKLYGSIENTCMLQFWWLIIALPLVLYGFYRRTPDLHPLQGLLLVLCVLSATVTVQILTHYIDSMTYLSGLTFIAGLLIYDKEKRDRQLSIAIMVCTLLFIINCKLTGIYHAAMLCLAAVIIIGLGTRSLPWKLMVIFAVTGLFALLFIGWRPYVTSLMNYGMLFPDNPETFSGTQRPSSFDELCSPARFFYSMFSATGGYPHQPAILKFPWQFDLNEMTLSGIPDARTGGYGPFFALGFLISLTLLLYVRIRKISINQECILLALLCLLFSAFFPQSWWMRYVPFGYVAPFFIACAVRAQTAYIRAGLCVIILCFATNITISGYRAYSIFKQDQQRFARLVETLKQHGGNAILIPPALNYERYNHAYMIISRRLAAEGINASVSITPLTPCVHKVEMYSEFKVCY